MKLHFSNLLFLLSAASKSSSLFADAQVAKVCESLQPYSYNSGDTRSATTTVSVAQAPWIQLDLSDSELAAGAKLTIVGDSATQVITASGLSSSNGFSAVFDGSSVSVELSSPGGVRGNGNTSRVVVSNVKVGLCKDDLTSSSIFGDIDDRVPSTDVRIGRIGGCTGWLISEDVFISAGHCGTPSSSTRIHFVFGVENAPPEDQYAVHVSSYQGVNGGVGNDWGAGRLLPNSVTGKLPGVAQSEKCGSPGCGWFNLGDVPTSTSGNNIRITGYGMAAVASRSQKTHVGALTTIGGTFVEHVSDTTGGNSGSPVVHEETGLAIGVHTHGGCSTTGGSNLGTRIDKPEFKAHVDSLLDPCTQDSDCDDGLFCNGAEICNAGKCMAGDPPSCDDGKGCTIDICNEAAKTCDYEPKCGQNDICIEPTGECEQCSGSDKRIEVDILTDNYPAETTWTVTDKCGASGVVLSGGPYDGSDTNTAFSKSVCATAGQYEFKIDDYFGDGICCGHGSGSYSVKYGGAEVASGGAFMSSETKSFGSACPSGPTSPPTPNPTTPLTASPTPNPTALPTNPPTPNPTICIEPTGECECSGSDKRIEVDILTDNYPAETTWTVTDKCGASGVVLSGGPYDGSDTNTAFSKSVCATAGQYEFKIDDYFGDGICCGYGSGSYSVKYGGAEVASGGAFMSSETKSFGSACPSGPTSPPTPNPTTPLTASPTPNPTALPTNPLTPNPTVPPTPLPTQLPTNLPTPLPTAQPTPVPTQPPSFVPSISRQPSSKPSFAPSSKPSSKPSSYPSTSIVPSISGQPSSKPSFAPSSKPSSKPSSYPSTSIVPSISGQPSSKPSFAPSSKPSSKPSSYPSTSIPPSISGQPSSKPSFAPSSKPSSKPSSYPSTSIVPSISGQPSSKPSLTPSSSSQPSAKTTKAPKADTDESSSLFE